MVDMDKKIDAQTVQSEDDILSCINAFFPTQHRSMPLGRGDDCAVMTTPSEICVSTDLFLEDMHFRRSYFTPEEIGHKALAVNISDIAAMGAKPLAFSMGLMLPKGIERDYLKRMMEGMANLAQQHDLALSGGDISRATSLGFSITIYGEAQEKGRTFLQRGTCHKGDIIFCVGDLGLARVGLLSLEKHGRTAYEHYPTACQTHLLPQPLVDAGAILAEYEGVSLMDLSDGLARDIPRLLGQQDGKALGADLELTTDMLHEDVLAFAADEIVYKSEKESQAQQKDAHILAIHHAFMGGEDYALLGACPPAVFKEICQRLTLMPAMPTIHRLGVVTIGPIALNGKTIGQSGFDHFA